MNIRRKQVFGKRPGIFRRAAERIVSRIPETRLPTDRKRIEEYLRILHPGEEKPPVREYYVDRLASLLAGAFGGLLFLILAAVFLESDDRRIAGNELERPAYGEEVRETELSLALEGQDQELAIPIQLHPRRLTAARLQELFEDVSRELDARIIGENSSLDEIRTDLNLVSGVEMEEGLVSVEWMLEPSDLVDSTGALLREPEKEGELVHLKAVMGFQGETGTYERYARVYPPVYTEEDALVKSSKKLLEEADQKNPYSAVVKLPEQMNGKEAVWRRPKESVLGSLSILLLILLIGLFVRKTRNVVWQVEQRRRQLILDYPSMVYKLTMLLGAGMTIRGAFFRLAGEYERRKGTKRYVYEEMCMVCHEIHSGVPESVAYEAFGKRCGHAAYRKLGSVLSQNLKKGSQGLVPLLEREALMTLEERRGAVRKLGEEAGTKLLIPMILMLIVVLAILIIPAIMSF